MVLILNNLQASDATGADETVALPTLAGASHAELIEALGSLNVPNRQLRMRSSQLWSWIYARGISAFAEMTDVSKDLRAKLTKAFSLERPQIVTEQVSQDGTRKWLLRLPKRGDEAEAPEVETVYIPEADRGTLCISSQVGCTLTCTFCHTGTQRLVRNLTWPDSGTDISLSNSTTDSPYVVTWSIIGSSASASAGRASANREPTTTVAGTRRTRSAARLQSVICS